MPAKKSRKQGKIAGVPTKEEPGHSTKGIPGVTGNRTPTERRVGSGNTRTGAIEVKKAAGEAGK
ncbi:MAG TPA: hypothetical protein VK993_05865 [Chthoniobacterales bacterium]|nr:hypothetical protein [Chthoniobacterales bacterium]